MRVLYLTMNPNRASSTVPTEGWFRFLRPRGLDPVLVSHRVGAFHAWAVEQGIPAYQVPLPVPSKLNPWPFFRSLWRLRRLVRRHRVQLIHCNEQEDIYPIGQYLGRLCKLPVVVSVHCKMERDFCEWAFGGARRPRRIFFISRGSREECRAAVTGLVPEAEWRLLYNGLDADCFRPDPTLREQFREKHGLGDGPVIGVACALRPGKQLEHLVEAAAQLSTPGLRVLLAGGPIRGEEKYAEGFLPQARQKLGERLLSLGHLSDLRGFLNALDLFVNTSERETCSISILEALACGCPVVGYPSISVEEQVLPGGGEIVEQNRIDQLTAALARWLSDPAWLSAARYEARRRVEQCFDIRKLADQLWGEYASLVN